MNMMSRLRSALAQLGLFRQDVRGNVAIIFGLAIIPMVGAVGAAVDYSRANSARTAMQAALDAAGLTLSKDAQTLTPAQLAAKATEVFNANYNHSEVKDVAVSASFSNPQPGSFRLEMTATGKVPTTLMAMWKPQMAIGTTAQIAWGMKQLELVLALDNTGSMSSSNKMTQLKLAAKDLLKTLEKAAKKPDDIKVAIVPFATDVNVSTSNVNANWIRWDEWEAEPAILDPDSIAKGSKPSSWHTTEAGSSCPFTKSSHGFQCVTTAQGTTTTGTIPSNVNYKGLICPSMDSGNKNSARNYTFYNGCYNTWTQCKGSECKCTDGNPQCGCSGIGSNRVCETKSKGSGKNKVETVEHTWRPTQVKGVTEYTPPLEMNGNVPYATPAHSTWKGCVTDRDQDNDVNNVATDINIKPTLYVAHQVENCPVEMLPLTNSWTTLNSKIDAMQPVGNTNVTIGLQMAFQMLSPVAPFNASSPKPGVLDKVIVLLTDGDNTQNRWSTSQSSIDARTKLACTNANNANIKLYTVRVINGNTTLLKGCATKQDMYYDVQNASQLSAVFSAIAQDLAQLRVAK